MTIPQRNNYITVEFFLALLMLLAYFMPWVDMDIFIKVVGWDMPIVQQELAAVSKEFVYNESDTNWAYGIFILPALNMAYMIFHCVRLLKMARIILTISSAMGIILPIYLFFTLPHIGSGVYILFVVSLLAFIVCINRLRCANRHSLNLLQ